MDCQVDWAGDESYPCSPGRGETSASSADIPQEWFFSSCFDFSCFSEQETKLVQGEPDSPYCI